MADEEPPVAPERPDDPNRAAEPERTADPDRTQAGASPTSRRSALRRAVRRIWEEDLTDWAAALTYYGVLSIFPGLLVLVSLLGLLGDNTINQVRDSVAGLAPGPAGELLNTAIEQVQKGRASAGTVALLGLLGAFWSASGYIAAFIRAANTIYGVPEGRPIWKLLPIRIALTAAIGVMLLLSTLIVVFTGRLAGWGGELLGFGGTAMAIWHIIKWPVLLVLVSLIFETLYWASPNARHGGFRFISPGGLLAVVVWLAASAGFALYVTNFGSYNKTFGTLAAVAVFLVWLWLSNLAILLGATLDAELARGRAIANGHPVDQEPFLELRDDRKFRDSSPSRDRDGLDTD
ncbi:MAG TPA: YihY/virulence factor BrkB family protein [Micromonosporaceae bacterium]|nr:YihY/virulence factor BrkB family protein [Micromonosporaceae bacterium]